MAKNKSAVTAHDNSATMESSAEVAEFAGSVAGQATAELASNVLPEATVTETAKGVTVTATVTKANQPAKLPHIEYTPEMLGKACDTSKLPQGKTTITVSGLAWFAIDFPFSHIVSIPSRNSQREGYDHIERPASLELIDSLAMDGYRGDKPRISVEPYDPAVHAMHLLVALDTQLAYLEKRYTNAVAANASNPAQLLAMDRAVSHFKSLYWIEPTLPPNGGEIVTPGRWSLDNIEAVVIGGNTRWFDAIIADGIRLSDGRTPIDEFPCNMFARPLTEVERDKEQFVENGEDGSVSKPTPAARTRAMKRIVQGSAKQNPDGTWDYPVDYDRFKALLTNGQTPTKSLQNQQAEMRPIIAADLLYPARRYIDRLEVKEKIAGLDPLVIGVAFAKNKYPALNEFLARAISKDRITANASRKTRAAQATTKGKATEYVPVTSPSHAERLKKGRELQPKAPFSTEQTEFIELTPITEDEVDAIISGAPQKPTDVKAALTAVAGAIGGNGAADTSASTKQLVDAITDMNVAKPDALKEFAKTSAPILDAAATVKSDYSASQWLIAIGKLDKTAAKSLYECLSEPDVAPHLLACSIALRTEHQSTMIIEALNVRSTKVDAVTKHLVKVNEG